MFPTNKTVILRADLNVPLIENRPANLFRFISFLPTLDALLKNKNKVIIITHLGKSNTFTPAPSTKLLMPIFTAQGYSIKFAQTIQEAIVDNKNDIILLENIRFIPQEMNNDLIFAQQLQKLGSFFVQDAFASLHNHHTSIITLPTLFQNPERSLGLLVQKEITQLDQFSLSDQTKTIYLLSGGKAKKIKYVYNLLNQHKTVLLGPTLCTPFLCLLYHKNSCCILNTDIMKLCFEIQKHTLFTTHIILPVDLFIKRENQQLVIQTEAFRPTDAIISIGTKTTYLFEQKIKEADSIVINGYMGFIDKAYCIEIMRTLLFAAFQKKHCLVGGGDTIFFIDSFAQTSSPIMRSTGGGAMLSYLAYSTLAGLQSFIKKEDTKTKNLTR